MPPRLAFVGGGGIRSTIAIAFHQLRSQPHIRSASALRSGAFSIKLTQPGAARNSIEYEGAVDVDKRLVIDLLKAAEIVRGKVGELGPVPSHKTGRR
jgi:hypothetical protein